MEKIIELLKQIGASDDLAKQLCEELKRHDLNLHEKYEKLYKQKLDEAKKICVEEVNKFKSDMARKVSVFLESKVGQIEKRVEQQKAVEELEASSKLRQVREITEGVEVADDAELKALREKVETQDAKIKTLAEEKKKAEVSANRANEMALEIIREHKSVIASAPKTEKTEQAKPEEKKVVTEGKATEAGKAGEKKNDAQKTLKENIEKKRRMISTARPMTTRKTLVESQVPATEKKVEGIVADNDIASIANQI
jgi:hypothetical protein